eukprot:c20169_g1_i1.p1 GENE.c20169_g1_i1~~c20169_g1_i1.p1  ORF type:complete len:273 (-),score=74.03 c20169_g1_i1:46-822(-)
MSAKWAKGYCQTMETLAANGSETFSQSPFSCRKPPPISLQKYAERLAQFMNATEQAFYVAGIYLARMYQVDKSIFGPHSCHKMMIAALTVAAKWTDDVFYTNQHYSEVGGVNLNELNQLEAEIARMLNWDLFVPRETYSKSDRWMKSNSAEVVLEQALTLRFAPKALHVFAPQDDEAWEYSVEESDNMDVDDHHTYRGAVDGSGFRVERDEDDEGFGLALAAPIRQAFGEEYGKTPLAPVMQAAEDAPASDMDSLALF